MGGTYGRIVKGMDIAGLQVQLPFLSNNNPEAQTVDQVNLHAASESHTLRISIIGKRFGMALLRYFSQH